MITYETFCRIHDCRERQGLTVAQTARALHLHPRTVAKWSTRSQFERRRPQARCSVLDAFKPSITRLLDTYPYSAVQIFQRVREEGYGGGLTIVRDYVRRIRPPKRPVYLKLAFAAGECAQIDWGTFGSVEVDNTRRRLSFFVMVLAFSRRMYVEFTVSQTMEHFLACHEHAFAELGVPRKIMLDNLKSAVLQRLAGIAPVFNPRFADFARHHGFEIVPCNVRRANEKGRVESGVGYVKKNFLRGLQLSDLSAVQASARVWLDSIANARIHGETQRRPIDLFAEERQQLRQPNPHPYDLARTISAAASSQFRITLDSNHYSVPSRYAHRRVTVKAHPDRVCVYCDNELIAPSPSPLWPALGHRGSGACQGADRATRPGSRAAADDALSNAVAGCGRLLRGPRPASARCSPARPQDPGAGGDLCCRRGGARHLRRPRVRGLQL